MFGVDQVYFIPVVVLIGVIFMIVSAKFVFRIALFVVGALVIWYCLAYVGLVPAPQQYFKNSQTFGELKGKVIPFGSGSDASLHTTQPEKVKKKPQ